MDNSIFNAPSEFGDYLFENITFQEFINERRLEAEQDVMFSGCTFNEPVILENITGREIIFHKCIFKKQFFLGGSNFHSISFWDCKFNDVNIFTNKSNNFSFRDVKAKTVEVNGEYINFQMVSSIIDELKLRDVNTIHTFKESEICFLTGNNIGTIRLNCSKSYSSILFKEGNYKSVHFEGEFYKHIYFKGDLEIQNLYFESSMFYSRIDLERGKFNWVSFYRCYFKGLTRIDDIFEVGENLESKIFLKNIMLHSCTFEKDFILNVSCELESFSYSNCHYHELLNFNNYDVSHPVLIRIDGVNQGSVVFERTFADISLTGINLGNLYLKDSTIETFYMNECQNNGIISFSKIRGGNFFVIQDSISGNINFINSNINEFREIVIVNSKIDEISFNEYPVKILSHSKFPQAGYGVEDKRENIKNLRSVYNQLKKIAKAKGEIDISNKFESLEYRQLLLSKKIGFDSILLSLNLLSNNNGRSWIQGVFFTLLIGFSFFLLYLNFTDARIYIDDDNLYKDYIIFLSSFPKLELKKYAVFNDEWNTQLILWLSRIFISYGIYQTIAAFRKYGKS